LLSSSKRIREGRFYLFAPVVFSTRTIMHFLDGDPNFPLFSMLQIFMGFVGVLCLVLASVTRDEEYTSLRRQIAPMRRPSSDSHPFPRERDHLKP
jgi:hypothetical protein